MTDNELHKALLTLVRIGVGHSVKSVPEQYDWGSIKTLAGKQGLLAIVLDAIDTLQVEERPERKLMMQWIGEVMKSYERRSEEYLQVISEMAGFYNSHGFKMMVLKGLACSLDWPRPEHRPRGDIDIWQFGKQKEADALVAWERGITVDTKPAHHTRFYWGGFMVENHYDFINLNHHRSNVAFERLLKELAAEENIGAEAPGRAIGSVEVKGERVYLPSANMHTLFILKHLMGHLAAEGIILRQVLDWGFHVKAHTKEIDWPWVMEVLEKNRMMPLFRVFNAICIEDLGFEASAFPEGQSQCDKELKERVLNDILTPEFNEKAPKELFSRIAFLLRRWKAKAWKQRLCYKESLWSGFWSSVWTHLHKKN